MGEIVATAEEQIQPHNNLEAWKSTEKASPCEQCKLRAFNICHYLIDDAPAAADTPDKSMWQPLERQRARRNIKSAGERANRVSILCDGWAFRFVQLPDGRRQILSIIVPGDVITPTRIFGEQIAFSVQALTDVRYQKYDRAALKGRLATDQRLADAWSDLILTEHQQIFGHLIDLGRRSADERVAHLVLELKARLKQRGLVSQQSFEFPLSQKIVADTTGLTPEHVSRVLGSFRRAGLIEATETWLRIINIDGLRRVGDLRI